MMGSGTGRRVQAGHGPAIAVAMLKRLASDAEQPAEGHRHTSFRFQRALRDALGIIVRNILPLRARHAVVVRRDADGALERDKMVDDAKAYSERIKGDSDAIVEQEFTQATIRLQAFAALGALRDAEERLKANITDGDQTRLLEEAITELETSSSAGGAA